MSTATAEPRSQEEIVRRYQIMTAECDKLVEKITELEFDRNEHSLVEETGARPIDWWAVSSWRGLLVKSFPASRPIKRM